MGKRFTVIAAGVLAFSLGASPGVLAKPGDCRPGNCTALLSYSVSPTTIEPDTGAVVAQGKLGGNRGCRAHRIVRFSYKYARGRSTALGDAVSKVSGDFRIELPRPVATNGATVVLWASVINAAKIEDRQGRSAVARGDHRSKPGRVCIGMIRYRTPLTVG